MELKNGVITKKAAFHCQKTYRHDQRMPVHESPQLALEDITAICAIKTIKSAGALTDEQSNLLTYKNSKYSNLSRASSQVISTQDEIPEARQE